MAITTKENLISIVKTELTADIVSLELSDTIISNNIDRALWVSSDYWNYMDYKTLDIVASEGSGGFIELSEIDPDGIPVITAVYPTQKTGNMDSSLLGLGSFYIQGYHNWNQRLNTYASMVSKLSQLESILGKNSRVVGDKLYVDKYYNTVTVAYIPNVVKVENINEGSWIQWIIEYAVALSKRQMAQARGKFTVDSNPHAPNAATLLEEANTALEVLREQLENKGVLKVSR